MLNVNSSIMFRRGFSVSNPAAYTTYMLRMKYEDGFEAQDNAGNITKLPAYASATDSPQYFGTVAVADKTKARTTLTHEMGKLAGTACHFAFPVRVQLNGGFHGVMDLVEDGDDRLLERNGLDGDGDLYKIYAEKPTSSPEKKTRQYGDNSDLNAMAAALDPAVALASRRTYPYDNINIPAAVNSLVVLRSTVIATTATRTSTSTATSTATANGGRSSGTSIFPRATTGTATTPPAATSTT